MSTVVRYSFPTEIFFGAGCIKQLETVLKRYRCQRPLLVTDKGLAVLPVFEGVFTLLRAHFDVAIYAGVAGNPDLLQVEAGVMAYREHRSDCIVAMGGGAAIDVAKAIGLMVNHPGHLFDYEDGKAGARPFDQAMPVLVAVPTTAGTGSEVGRSTVISDPVTKVKKIIFDPILLPKTVLADPELIVDLPAKVTAATGMDALSHLTESFLVNTFHPICDGIATEGMRLLGKSLRQCVQDAYEPVRPLAERVYSRGLMMNASMMGAIAFQKGLGVTHSCAHALSTVCDLHHGLANGIMLPYAMAFNRPVCEDKMARLAGLVGQGENAKAFLNWLVELQVEIGIPQTLKEVGVKEHQLAELVSVAIKDSCHESNPRRVSEADFEAIFRAAY